MYNVRTVRYCYSLISECNRTMKSFGSLLSSPSGLVWIKKNSCIRGVLICAHGCCVGFPLPAIDPAKVSAKFCSFCLKWSSRCSTFSCTASEAVPYPQKRYKAQARVRFSGYLFSTISTKKSTTVIHS
jgi:hypothetical protein